MNKQTLSTQTLSTLKVVVLALVLGLGISYAQAVWTGPTAAPTGNNVEAPVNIGPTAQIKTGDLTVKNLKVTGDMKTNGATTSSLGSLDVTGSNTSLPAYADYAGINFKNTAGIKTGSVIFSPLGMGFMNTNQTVWPWYVTQAGNTRQPGTISIGGGSPATGKVLTATNVAGDATWQTPATAASGAPTFITPVLIVNLPSTSAVGVAWTTYNASSIIPPGAKVMIIEYSWSHNGGPSSDAPFFIKIRKNSSSPQYAVATNQLYCSLDCNPISGFDQEFFPISDTRTFDYMITGNYFTFKLSIIGYM